MPAAVVKVSVSIHVRPSVFVKSRYLCNTRLCDAFDSSEVVQQRTSNTLTWRDQTCDLELQWLAEVELQAAPESQELREQHALAKGYAVTFEVENGTVSKSKRTPPTTKIGSEERVTNGLVDVKWSMHPAAKADIARLIRSPLNTHVMLKCEQQLLESSDDSVEQNVLLFRDFLHVDTAARSSYPGRVITSLFFPHRRLFCLMTAAHLRRACFAAALTNRTVGILLSRALLLVTSPYLGKCIYISKDVRQSMTSIFKFWFVINGTCILPDLAEVLGKLEAPISKHTAYVTAAERRTIRQALDNVVKEETGYCVKTLMMTNPDLFSFVTIEEDENLDEDAARSFAETLPEQSLPTDLDVEHVLSLCSDISSRLPRLTAVARSRVAEFVRSVVGPEVPFQVRDDKFLRSIVDLLKKPHMDATRASDTKAEDHPAFEILFRKIQIVLPTGKAKPLIEKLLCLNKTENRSILSFIECVARNGGSLQQAFVSDTKGETGNRSSDSRNPSQPVLLSSLAEALVDWRLGSELVTRQRHDQHDTFLVLSRDLSTACLLVSEQMDPT